MEAMPTYQMEALAYHEGIPGHHMQIAISQELEGVPKFRKFGGYTAYIEGWGLYSELLPKEMGYFGSMPQWCQATCQVERKYKRRVRLILLKLAMIV